ncbi:MAG: type II toxin-antitoxin system RelE/ParE family toxin [Chloroflexi bacterium]|nr:type II toxin-antitoxin system RelE/ParE family toxin [Chloroflexota bacterium]
MTERARRDPADLARQVAARVVAALERFAETGHGDVKPLQGTDGEWRLRVGDWRVRFVFDYPSRTIYVLRVLPRGRAYRD